MRVSLNSGSARSCMQTSTPSISGIMMSSTIRSGFSALATSDRLATIVGGVNAIALAFQVVFQQFEDVLLIIHQQYLGHSFTRHAMVQRVRQM